MMCLDPRPSSKNNYPKMILIDEENLNLVESDEILIIKEFSKIKNSLEK